MPAATQTAPAYARQGARQANGQLATALYRDEALTKHIVTEYRECAEGEIVTDYDRREYRVVWPAAPALLMAASVLMAAE